MEYRFSGNGYVTLYVQASNGKEYRGLLFAPPIRLGLATKPPATRPSVVVVNGQEYGPEDVVGVTLLEEWPRGGLSEVRFSDGATTRSVFGYSKPVEGGRGRTFDGGFNQRRQALNRLAMISDESDGGDQL